MVNLLLFQLIKGKKDTVKIIFSGSVPLNSVPYVSGIALFIQTIYIRTIYNFRVGV